MKISVLRFLVRQPQGLRFLLAGLRLFLLFPLFCFLGAETLLLLRTTQESSGRLVEPRPALDLALPFLGINVALENSSPLERQAALHRLHQTGFRWVRQRLDWGQIEAQPEHYDWHASDALVADVVAAGFVPVLVLDGSPAWARAEQDRGATDNPFAPPADPATFARFATKVAQRYQGQVRFYQLWDEPNIAPHWGNRHIEPVGYARLLKAAAPAIRTADPAAVIVLAALAPTADRGHQAVDEVYFLQRLYAAGAAPFFDVAAAQPFGFGAGPSDERARLPVLNFQRVKLLRRTMLAAGDGTTPIWAVRYGWNTHRNSNWRTATPTDQAAFATAALTLARYEWPWLTAMGWAIDQPAQPPTDPQWGFALTPTVAAAIRTWQPPTLSPISTGMPVALGWRWLGITLLWGLIGWRVSAALTLLPWLAWGQWYKGWPLCGKVLVWLLVALSYFFATWPPLILLCWVAATLLILPAPLTGLALGALLLPFYFQHKELAVAGFGVVIPPAHAILGCLGVALLARGAAKWAAGGKDAFCPLIQLRHPIDGLALLWLLINLISTLAGWGWPGAGQGLLNLALLPALAYIAIRLFVTTARQRTILNITLLTGGLGVALSGLWLWWQGQGTAADGVLRLVGPYFSPNHAALYLERVGWLGVGLACSWRGARQHWFWGATGVMAAALWLTASRGAWLLGMPAGALVFAWGGGLLQPALLKTLWLRRPRYWLVILMVAFLFIGALGLITGQPLWARLANSATVIERLQIWQATWRLWLDHWLLGVGPGNFFWHYPRYWLGGAESDPNLLHPHNLWFELLAGWGVLGLGWFLLLGWQLGRLLVWAREQPLPPWQAIGLLAAFAAGIAHGQVDTFAALPDLALWQWLALGLLVAEQCNTEIRRDCAASHEARW